MPDEDDFDDAEYGEGPFRDVVRFDTARLLDRLRSGLDPDTRNERGETLLVVASRGLSIDAVRALISAGATTSGIASDRGFPPLYLAAAADAIGLVHVLRAAGCDLRMPTGEEIRSRLRMPRRRVLEALSD